MGCTDDQLLDLLVQALDEAEEHYPYVTRERLRSVARSDPEWRIISARLSRILMQAQQALLVLSDERHRLTRGGAFQPITLYRLNRRSPRVRTALS